MRRVVVILLIALVIAAFIGTIPDELPMPDKPDYVVPHVNDKKEADNEQPFIFAPPLWILTPPPP